LHLSGGSTSLPIIRLQRNDTSVQPDDLIGGFENYSNDADGAFISSYVKGYATETYGRQGYLTFGTAGTNSTDATEKMRIAADGNVGIGNTNPQGTLDLGNATGGKSIVWGGSSGTNHYTSIWSEYGSASLVLAGGLKSSTSSADFIYPYTGTYGYAAIELDSFHDDGIKFYTAADAARTADTVATKQERMRIDTSGNVGIGTDNPTRKLDVRGNATNAVFRASSTSGVDAGIQIQGARNGTVDGETSYIHFTNYDDNASPVGVHNLGRIYGSMASAQGYCRRRG
jgi:hypothetical protein